MVGSNESPPPAPSGPPPPESHPSKPGCLPATGLEVGGDSPESKERRVPTRAPLRPLRGHLPPRGEFSCASSTVDADSRDGSPEESPGSGSATSTPAPTVEPPGLTSPLGGRERVKRAEGGLSLLPAVGFAEHLCLRLRLRLLGPLTPAQSSPSFLLFHPPFPETITLSPELWPRRHPMS